jgi:large subunit ribosomal protein L13|tara:strand:- start:2003 stop:2398 length:396 start_codon:yes stop_codon:yes gene_type:complete
MVKIIDGKNTVLGRLASFAAKEAIKGEEIVVLNCAEVIITGSKKNIKENFEKKRERVGSGQQGPKHSRLNDRIVKRTIRGMLPNHRRGRGKEIFKKIKCYVGVPKEFQDSKKIELKLKSKNKFIMIKDIGK